MYFERHCLPCSMFVFHVHSPRSHATFTFSMRLLVYNVYFQSDKRKRKKNRAATKKKRNRRQTSSKNRRKYLPNCIYDACEWVYTIRCVASFVRQFGINDVMIHWNSPLCAPNQFSMDYSACACMWRRRWRCFNFAIAYNMGTMTRVPLNFDWNVSKLLTSGKRKNEHGNTRKTNAETLYRWYRWWAIFCSRYRFYADSRINLC